MHSGNLADQKKKIREKMRRLRDSLDTRDIYSKSSAIEARLWQLIEDQEFESIMFYIAFGSEVRTQECIAQAIDSAKTVIVPLCSADGERQLLPCRLFDLQSEVEESAYGILEPKPEFRRPFPPEKIDLVVVPGLAFDENGYRIGYGGGYYDRFLARCPQVFRIGLAYEIQIVPYTVPTTWDVLVHKIITEDRIISCRSREGF